jgi:AcrR family transcriptional regulator
MAKTGRKSIYDTVIAPHIDEIRKAVENGATVKEIASALGIAESTLNKYKAEKKELTAAFMRGRANIIIEIRGALLKKALGYDYEEEKRVGRKDGKGENIVLVEKYKKHQPPSETAAAMLLRNYDESWLDKDSTTTQLKQQEFELRKAMADNDIFDLGE